MTYREIGRLANQVRAIPLTEVLLLLNAIPDRHDKARWKTPQGAISVTGTRFFDWQRQAGGGGAIDLVMQVRQVDFKTAVFWLRDTVALSSPAPGPEPAQARIFHPPPRQDRNLPRVIHYLECDRGLPESILAPLIRQRLIYADPRANAVFLLRDRQQRPVGAELRGTTAVRWRGMAPGSCKDAGFFSVGQENPDTIVLCESAIDAMSCHALRPTALCLSTAGATPNPAWLPELIATGRPVACGFDTDETGDHAACAMIARYPGMERLRPERHDWNDDLIARRDTQHQA